MEREQIKKIIEGALFAAGGPLSLVQLGQLFEEKNSIDNKQIKEIINGIVDDYQGRGIELNEVASGYRFQVVLDLAPWIGKLWEERPPRYSRALLETLALIAYKQPITRAEIEEVRGVAVSTSIIRTLLEREWVKIVGHKDVPGKPALFVTTNNFLDYFDLKGLKELPTLAEIKDLDQFADRLEFGANDVQLEIPLPGGGQELPNGNNSIAVVDAGYLDAV